MTKRLKALQTFLEESYGAYTGLDVSEFVVSVPKFQELGELLIEQKSDRDLDIALLLDRDVLAAWESHQSTQADGCHRSASVAIEETSHFVYLGFNHLRGRNVTRLEMELQSEVDRILVSHQSEFFQHAAPKEKILSELFDATYSKPRYEESRQIAKAFIQRLCGGDPHAWTAKELEKLQKFFHSDLAEKIHLSRKS